MKKLTLTIAALLLLVSGGFAGVISDLSAAELKAIDLSGHYTGKRYQYAADGKTVMQTFQYEFELRQEGSAISGTSTIIKENGDYADIKLRGTIVGDKVYFEEYEIASQIKDENMVWCFKSGALNIRKDGDRVKLVGATNSYMAEYYLPCTGGETDLTKVESSPTLNPNAVKTGTTGLSASDVMSVYPDPFVDQTKISYTLQADAARVTTEVYDITGRRVAVLESEAQRSAGSHSVTFSAKSFGISAGVLIAKVSVDGVVYSSEMVQMK